MNNCGQNGICFPCHAFEIKDKRDVYETLQFKHTVVKDYGEYLSLEDGTMLHHNYCDNDEGGRELDRCKICGGFVLHQRTVFEDGLGGAYGDYIPVSSVEEGDLLNILLSGDDVTRYPFRHFRAYFQEYYWEGDKEPSPYNPDALRDEIRKKYSGLNPDQKELLEKMIRATAK